MELIVVMATDHTLHGAVYLDHQTCDQRTRCRQLEQHRKVGSIICIQITNKINFPRLPSVSPSATSDRWTFVQVRCGVASISQLFWALSWASSLSWWSCTCAHVPCTVWPNKCVDQSYAHSGTICNLRCPWIWRIHSLTCDHSHRLTSKRIATTPLAYSMCISFGQRRQRWVQVTIIEIEDVFNWSVTITFL